MWPTSPFSGGSPEEFGGRPETRVPCALQEGRPGGSTASVGDYRLRASSPDSPPPKKDEVFLPPFLPASQTPAPGPAAGEVCAEAEGFRLKWGRLRLSGGPVLPQDPPQPYTLSFREK